MSEPLGEDEDRNDPRSPRQPLPAEEAVLAEVIRRIVAVAAPEKIVLFGSAARGEAGPDSDLDLLVIKAGEYRRLDVMAGISAELFGVGAAVDIVVVTPEDVDRYQDDFARVIAPAIHEGRVVYGA